MIRKIGIILIACSMILLICFLSIYPRTNLSEFNTCYLVYPYFVSCNDTITWYTDKIELPPSTTILLSSLLNHKKLHWNDAKLDTPYIYRNDFYISFESESGKKELFYIPTHRTSSGDYAFGSTQNLKVSIGTESGQIVSQIVHQYMVHENACYR